MKGCNHFFKCVLFFCFNGLIYNIQNCTITAPEENIFLPNQILPMAPVEIFTIIELNSSTGARCLDGTNVKFNYSAGWGSGKLKFFFTMQGGGFCGENGYEFLESCLQRSSTYLGSSKDLGDNGTQINLNTTLGYFSNNQDDNPKFFNWNKIGMNYCDGSNFQGYVEDAVNVNGTDLWFRGYNNSFAIFEYARKNYGLFEAEEIILSGASAGAHAIYTWAAYLQDYFPKNIKIAVLADGGFFLDVYNTYAGCNLLRFYIKKMANATKSKETDLFRRCKYRNTTKDWKCLLPEYIIDSIELPLFIANSQNDYEALRTHYGIKCIVYGADSCNSFEKKLINEYRIQFLNTIFIIKEKHPKWGFWSRSCLDHVYQRTWAWYSDEMNAFSAEMNDNRNFRDVFNGWYEALEKEPRDSFTYIDLVSWENNCPGNFSIVRKPLGTD